MQVREVVVDAAQMFMVMELVDFDLGLLIEHMKQPFSEGQAPNRPWGFSCSESATLVTLWPLSFVPFAHSPVSPC